MCVCVGCVYIYRTCVYIGVVSISMPNYCHLRTHSTHTYLFLFPHVPCPFLSLFHTHTQCAPTCTTQTPHPYPHTPLPHPPTGPALVQLYDFVDRQAPVLQYAVLHNGGVTYDMQWQPAAVAPPTYTREQLGVLGMVTGAGELVVMAMPKPSVVHAEVGLYVVGGGGLCGG